MGQISLNGFNLCRRDHTEHYRGIMVYVRNDLPQGKRYDLVVDSQEIKSGRVESVVVELITNGIKGFCLMYTNKQLQ